MPASSKYAQGTNWCFTINNPDENYTSIWDEDTMKYLVEGHEIGQEGTPHVQGFVVMLSRQRLSGMKQISCRAHWELAHGTAIQAAVYCKKDGNYQEKGTCPQEGRKREPFAHKEVYHGLKDGTLSLRQVMEDHPEQITWIRHVQDMVPPREAPAKVLYLYGSTGLGKTTNTVAALKDLNIPYWKKQPGHKWFTGYRGEDVIIFEEFTSCFLLTQWLSLCDPEPPLVETKGGHIHIQATKYIILSNLGPG